MGIGEVAWMGWMRPNWTRPATTNLESPIGVVAPPVHHRLDELGTGT